MRPTVTVMMSVSVVVEPLVGLTPNQGWSSLMLQVRVPPPVFLMVKLSEVFDVPKSREVGDTLGSTGGGSIS